jgi:hypothetical protein
MAAICQISTNVVDDSRALLTRVRLRLEPLPAFDQLCVKI